MQFGASPPGYRQLAAGLAAHGPDDCVELLFDVLDAHVLADAGIQARLDVAERQHPFHLAAEHRTGHPVLGDPVHHHAAQFFVIVEDGRCMALAAQVVGRGHAAGAATNDRDALAGERRGRLEAVTLGQRVVPDELFDRVDADEVFDLVAVAARLTGGRADTAHHRGEGVGVGGATERVFLPGHVAARLLDAPHDLQPAADILAGRAGALAGRRAVHVDRALVGMIALENGTLPVPLLVVAVAEFAEGQFHVIA